MSALGAMNSFHFSSSIENFSCLQHYGYISETNISTIFSSIQIYLRLLERFLTGFTQRLKGGNKTKNATHVVACLSHNSPTCWLRKLPSLFPQPKRLNVCSNCVYLKPLLCV